VKEPLRWFAACRRRARGTLGSDARVFHDARCPKRSTAGWRRRDAAKRSGRRDRL